MVSLSLSPPSHTHSIPPLIHGLSPSIPSSHSPSLPPSLLPLPSPLPLSPLSPPLLPLSSLPRHTFNHYLVQLLQFLETMGLVTVSGDLQRFTVKVRSQYSTVRTSLISIHSSSISYPTLRLISWIPAPLLHEGLSSWRRPGTSLCPVSIS